MFTVTRLVADGYDDAHAPELPLIVRYRDGTAMGSAAPVARTRRYERHRHLS